MLRVHKLTEPGFDDSRVEGLGLEDILKVPQSGTDLKAIILSNLRA